MNIRRTSLLLVALGIVGTLMGAMAMATSADDPELTRRGFAPLVVRAEPTPIVLPTPKPPPYAGLVAGLYLESASISYNWAVEQRGTEIKNGVNTFQDPSNPLKIAWYPAFGRPGFPANNSIFAAHVNYIGYGLTPFAYLTSADVGDTLYVKMDNGLEIAYSVQSVVGIHLSQLDMDAVVFPALNSSRERITLISCGGTFIGGGAYDSRVILVAERIIE